MGNGLDKLFGLQKPKTKNDFIVEPIKCIITYFFKQDFKVMMKI